MDSRIHDLTGKEYGRLRVIKALDERHLKRVVWLCECDCKDKTKVKVSGTELVVGNVRSCGCLMREKLREGYESHRKDGVIAHRLTAKTPTNNTSGVKGVCYDKSRGNWMAYITIKRKRVWSRRFATLEEAVQARLEAEEIYFKPILEKDNKEG